MIPPLVFALANQRELADEVASRLGTTAINSEQMIGQPHLYLSEVGLSFFHPEARSKHNFQIDFDCRFDLLYEQQHLIWFFEFFRLYSAYENLFSVS